VKLKIKFIQSFFVFFVLTSFFGLVSVKHAFAANYQLSGSVRDNSGTAVSGTVVHVYSPGTTTDIISSTTTDTSGNYSFTSVPGGTYDIKVIPPAGSNFTSAIALSQNITLTQY